MKRIGNTKKLLALALVVVMVLMMTACGGGNEQALKDVPSADLAKAMAEAESSLPDMTTATEEDPEPEILLQSVTDMEFDKFDAFFITYSNEGLADEIVVLRVKDEKDVEDAAAALEDHQQKRSAMYSTYDPTQVERVDNGIVFTEGKYAVLIVTEHPTDVQAAFEKAVTDDAE